MRGQFRVHAGALSDPGAHSNTRPIATKLSVHASRAHYVVALNQSVAGASGGCPE
jgi:hypothetical protein